ncbi:MAG: hypothetical protein MUO88_10165, partial [Desulfobacterales bacterium]|nr:hypothetical protein [Desulfobacterales bacterium]
MKKLLLIMIILMCCLACVTFGANDTKDEDSPDEQKTAEEVVEKAAEKAAEKAVEKVTEETVEKVAEKAVEKAEEKAAEKAELKAKRPEEWWETTKIHFFVFVVDIDNIDGAGQSFTTNVYVRLRWKDSRLAHDGSVRTVPLEETWNPRVLIANQGGLIQKSLPEVVEIERDGTVIYHQRYTGPLSQPLKLSEFPFDQHNFTIQFVATGYSVDEIEFLPDTSMKGGTPTGGGLYHELSLPDWTVLKYQTHASPYEAVKDRKTAAFAFEFTAKRAALYYIWQVIIPLVVIVVMAWGAFYIAPTNAGAQIGIATSSMLTLIAYRFMLGNLIPRLPYMTRLDYFLLGSTILVFLTLVEVIITTNLALRQREKIALAIDHW